MERPKLMFPSRTEPVWWEKDTVIAAEDLGDRQMLAGGCCLTDLPVDREKRTNTA